MWIVPATSPTPSPAPAPSGTVGLQRTGLLRLFSHVTAGRGRASRARGAPYPWSGPVPTTAFVSTGDLTLAVQQFERRRQGACGSRHRPAPCDAGDDRR